MNAKQKRPSIGLIIDVVQAFVAIVAAIILALDSTGLLDLPWLQERLSELTFIAICALIVTSVIDRKFTIQAQEKEIRDRFEQVNRNLQKIQEAVSGNLSADTLLKDRTSFTTPLEIRLQDAKEVCLSGKSLVGIITAHKSLISKHANRGCRFRIIVNDPNMPEMVRKKEIEQSLYYIHEMQRYGQTAEYVEVRVTTAPLSCSLVMIDPSSDSGHIQVEYYAYRVPGSDRPSLKLLPTRDPKWYTFYKSQFELLWDHSKHYSTVESEKKPMA